MSYSKLFSDIVHSTIWREEMHVKVVWITMLAMADRHGRVMSSIPGLADSAKVTLEQCLDALDVFRSPDKYSRTKDYEGRRISDIDGGWLILNYEKFRSRKDDEEQRQRTKERVRLHRERQKSVTNNVTEDVTVTRSNPIADTDTEETNMPSSPKAANVGQAVLEVFEYWKEALTHPRAKLDAKRKRKIQDRLKEGYSAEDIKQAVRGLTQSPHNMGQNDSNTIYDDIELVCRDAIHLERFMARDERQAQVTQQPKTLEDFMSKEEIEWKTKMNLL